MEKLKVVLLLSLAFLFCGQTNAQTVSEGDARAKALEFFSNGAKKLPAKNGAKRQAPAVGNVELAYTSQKEGKTCFYVFNNGTDGGFVIVGGDENVQTILAYSLSGYIDMENASENFKWWINTTENNISASLLSGRKYFVENKSDSYVEPLITTKWNQHYPYNLKTPIGTLNNGDKINCPTGCVATAMAQVMNYHKFPDHGTGFKNYQIFISGTGEKHEISYDFSSVNFDWDNMCDTYTEDNTDVEKDAVATLMFACGVSVDMEYNLGESGAQASKVIPVLHNTFGYSAYQISSSFQSIKSELDEGCPLIYSGTGHMFVVDGYDADGYLHLNMGWGGVEDGYYAIDNMNGYKGGTTIAAHKPNNEDVSDYEWYGFIFDLYGKDHTASLKRPIKYDIKKANIPDSVFYKGSYYKVTSMQSDAFLNCSSLQSVVISQSVEFIPTYAFMGCDKLTNVVLQEGLKSIEVQAFSYCPALKNINIPSTITNIGQHAFSHSGIQEITIPKDAVIGYNPFYGCHELSSINIDKDNPYYYYSDGGVYEKSTNNLLCVAGGYGQTLVIKEGTQVIDVSACAGTSISEFVLPNSIVGIGLGAFNDNYSIKRIVLPESLRSFYCSFYNCLNLEYIYIPASVNNIAFDEHEFKDCEKLKTIDIAPEHPNYMVEDGVVFNKDKTIICKACVGLKDNYVVPTTVKEVATGAFAYCNNLHHIDLSSVKYLGGSYGSVFDNCKNLESIVIPEGVSQLLMHTFSNCSNLTEISLPSTLVAAHPSSFRLCNNLKYIDVNFLRPLPDTNHGGFDLFGTTSKGVAYVPKGTKEYFENDNVWKDLTIVEKELNPDAVLADSVVFIDKVEIASPWDTLQFKAKVYPENASQEIVWATNVGQSYNASVDENGLVTINSPFSGAFTVFAMTKDGSNVFASCNVEVKKEQEAENVKLCHETLTMREGAYHQLNIVDEKGEKVAPESYVWVSDNEDIVSVSENGVLYAKNLGFARISLLDKMDNHIIDECYTWVLNEYLYSDDNIRVTPGDTIMVPISLVQDDQNSLFFDMVLPYDIYPVFNQNTGLFEMNMSKDFVTENHTLSSTYDGEILHIEIVSPNYQYQFKQSDAVILSIPLFVSESATIERKTISIINSRSIYRDFWHDYAGFETIIDIILPQKGDVNGDGKVDVIDINAIVNVILDNTSAGNKDGLTDVNGDGKTDVIDINALINIILGQ